MPVATNLAEGQEHIPPGAKPKPRPMFARNTTSGEKITGKTTRTANWRGDRVGQPAVCSTSAVVETRYYGEDVSRDSSFPSKSHSGKLGRPTINASTALMCQEKQGANHNTSNSKHRSSDCNNVVSQKHTFSSPERRQKSHQTRRRH